MKERGILMKTIAFFNVKGGCGKTTSCINISYILATKYEKKVLLIDLDPQANSSDFLLTKTMIRPSKMFLLAGKHQRVYSAYQIR